MKSKVIVWTQPDCVWCDRVKIALEKAGHRIVERDITSYPTGIREKFKEEFKTTPQVFIEDRHIGGHDDTIKWLEKTS